MSYEPGRGYYIPANHVDRIQFESWLPSPYRFEKTIDAHTFQGFYNSMGACKDASLTLGYDPGWTPVTNTRIIKVRAYLKPGTSSYTALGRDPVLFIGHVWDIQSGGRLVLRDIADTREEMDIRSSPSFLPRVPGLSQGTQIFGGYGLGGEASFETTREMLARIGVADVPLFSYGHTANLDFVMGAPRHSPATLDYTLSKDVGVPLIQGFARPQSATEYGWHRGIPWELKKLERANIPLLAPHRFLANPPDPQVTERSAGNWVADSSTASGSVSLSNSGTAASSTFASVRVSFSLSRWTTGVKSFYEFGPDVPTFSATYRPLSATQRIKILNLNTTGAVNGVYVHALSWIASQSSAGMTVPRAGDTVNATQHPSTKYVLNHGLTHVTYNQVKTWTVEFALPPEGLMNRAREWGSPYFWHCWIVFELKGGSTATNLSANYVITPEDFLQENLATEIPKPKEAQLPYISAPTFEIDSIPAVVIPPSRFTFTDPVRGKYTQYLAGANLNITGSEISTSVQTAAPY